MSRIIPVKILLLKDLIHVWRRRFEVSNNLGVKFSDVTSQIDQFVDGPYSLEYVDDFGDTILMDTEIEWNECVKIYLRLKQAEPKSLLHLRVNKISVEQPKTPPAVIGKLSSVLPNKRDQRLKIKQNQKKKRPQNLIRQMLTKHSDGARLIRKAFRQQLRTMSASARLEIAQIKKARKQPPCCLATMELPRTNDTQHSYCQSENITSDDEWIKEALKRIQEGIQYGQQFEEQQTAIVFDQVDDECFLSKHLSGGFYEPPLQCEQRTDELQEQSSEEPPKEMKIDERQLAVLCEAQEYERDLHLEQEVYVWKQLINQNKEQHVVIDNKTRGTYPAEITKLSAMGFIVGTDILDLLRKDEGNLVTIISKLL